MRILGGIYDIKGGTFSSDFSEIDSLSEEKREVQIFGTVRNEEKEIGCDELFALWKKLGDSVTEKLSGSFIVLLYDGESGAFSVYHDHSSSPVALYYTVKDEKLHVSTSLRKVLASSGIERRLNEDKICDFLTNGFIPGEETLASGVYKLKFFHSLSVRDGNALQIPVRYGIEEMSEEEAKEKWCGVLDSAVGDCVSGREINSPLSGGYDSNYILYIEDRDFDLPINCFSVGGKSGRNELPVVKENAEKFEKVNLRTAVTDENMLNDLPEIVLRLEGAVFEVGLFLQLALARLVSEAGKDYLICGECADQVMNENYFVPDRLCADYGEKNKYYDFAEYPMAYGHYIILKKNGIMCNTFGIESRYPFLDRRFLPVAKALGKVNGKNKAYHVKTCERLLAPSVIANIAKVGGATDVHSLFDSKASMDRFIKAVKSSSLYKEYGKIASLGGNFCNIEKKSAKETLRRIVYALKGKKIVKDFYIEEAGLRELLCYAYVIVFEKTILSGRYDDTYAVNESLFDLIK